MNGFSNGQFDTSVIERGMLITVTSQHGGSKSGIVTNVTAERIRYSLLDSFLGSFQEDEVTAGQVSEGFLTFVVRKHLHTDAKVSQGTRQEAKRSVKEMLQNDFDLDTLASLIKEQQDAQVIAYIFYQLGELPPNESAKLFVSIDDRHSITLALDVQKELSKVETWSEEKKQELEAIVSHLLESYVQKQGNQSEPSFENPLEDLFEKLSGGLGGLGGFGGLGGGSNPLTDMLEELKNGKNPLFDLFGGGFGQGKQQTQMPQEMVDQLKEVLRQIFNDDNNKPGGRF